MDPPSVVSVHRHARSPSPPHGGSHHTSDCEPQTQPQTPVAARHRSSPANTEHYFIETCFKYPESTVGFANVPDQWTERRFHFAYIQTQYVHFTVSSLICIIVINNDPETGVFVAAF